MIERTSPTDLMQLASDLPGSPMQVAAILVLSTTSAVDISVPVAARLSATARHLGNEVGVMTVPVTVAGDLNQRLAAIARTTRNRRPATPSVSVALLGPVFRTLAGLGVFRWFVDRQHLVTTMVTNHRGPAVRLSFLAAPITEVIPVSLFFSDLVRARSACGSDRGYLAWVKSAHGQRIV